MFGLMACGKSNSASSSDSAEVNNQANEETTETAAETEKRPGNRSGAKLCQGIQRVSRAVTNFMDHMEREGFDMLQTIMVLIVNTLIYAGIGMLVGVAIAYFQAMEGQLLYLLWRGALTGIVIGTVTKSSVVLLHRKRNSSMWSLYGLMLLIAGGLTLVTSFSLNMATKLAVLSIVEPLALLTMFLNIRYSERLNAGLKRKQSALGQKAARMP